METVFLLRSYGDFVIALSGSRRSQRRDLIRIVASDHFRPLYEAIAETKIVQDLPDIEFVDLGVRYGLMACFTNRHFFSSTNIQELKKIRGFMATVPDDHDLFLEQRNRAGFIAAITSRKFSFVHNGTENIYDAYGKFFHVTDVPFYSKGQMHHNRNSIVRVFPGSRKKVKRLPLSWISKINDRYQSNGIQIQLTGLAEELLDYTGPKQLFGNFRELCDLIAGSDYIISSDSLPAHLAYLFSIPLEVHYNGSVNSPWLPPGAVAKLVRSVLK